jgi:hypothetical protein
MKKTLAAALAIAFAIIIVNEQFARAQSYGVDLHNTTNPASGGLAGTSLACPQDLQSAIAGNPSTLAQFHGSQFRAACCPQLAPFRICPAWGFPEPLAWASQP